MFDVLGLFIAFLMLNMKFEKQNSEFRILDSLLMKRRLSMKRFYPWTTRTLRQR